MVSTIISHKTYNYSSLQDDKCLGEILFIQTESIQISF